MADIDDEDGQQAEPPHTADNALDQTPKRRAKFVLPEKKKRKFQDGTPKPAKSLQSLMKKVSKERYKYTPLGHDEDIRVLIVEPGRPADSRTLREADPVRCKLVPSALPSTQATQVGVHPRQVIRYEALSYYWGLDDPTIPITIASYNTSIPRLSMANIVQKKFWIRPNLHAALVQLRDPIHEVFLWVDALCIDQENIVEKTQQVSRMHEIYSEAANICIWLGVGEVDPAQNAVDVESTRHTFDFIRDMLNLKRLDQLICNEQYASGWLAFVKLMRNRWFSRRWVVQELALAREATVHYGQEVMQWTDFADAVALFVTKHDQINALLKKCYSMDPDIGDMRALGANTLVEATSNLFRKSNDGKILERLLSLETLVSTLLAFESSDPKDTVYAVLSIANDTPYSDSTSAARTIASRTTSAVSTPVGPGVQAVGHTGDHRITPNYDKSLGDICTDFVDYCIEKSESLDIICRHWAPVSKGRRRSFTGAITDQETCMPSWISLISGSAFGTPEQRLQGRSNGDSLVGTPSRQHQKTYSASAGLKPLARITRHVENEVNGNGIRDEPVESYFQGGHTASGHSGNPRRIKHEQGKRCSGTLFAKGMILDTIGKLSPRAAQGMILQECLEMGGWSDDDELEKVPDSLWRTLVADRGPDGKSAPSWYHRACLECFTHVTQNGDLSTGALMENPNTPSTMVLFLKRVQQVVWNRKFLRSRGGENKVDEKQLFGLAPTHAQEGDLICILFGCSVPVILRKKSVPEGDEPYYFFIGEAYVHGMMDGEALAKEMPKYPYDDCVNFEIH